MFKKLEFRNLRDSTTVRIQMEPPGSCPLIDHVRHLLSSGWYYRSELFKPVGMISLARGWYRNEVSYWCRTSRLRQLVAVDRRELNELFKETSAITAYCAAHLGRYHMMLPDHLNPNYGPVFYALVRLLRPQVVVETGIASGVSSTFFLTAMEKNGIGRLFSIDLPLPNERLVPQGLSTGWIVPDEVRGRWEVRLGDARTELPALFKQLPTVDFFYHDSEHSYEHMSWEYSLAYPFIRPGGLLISDDVTCNGAWDDFMSSIDGQSTRVSRTGIHKTPPIKQVPNHLGPG